jgi:predicted acetyltransferase
MAAVDEVFDITFLENISFIKDEGLTLILEEKVPADHAIGFSPYYKFSMQNTVTEEIMGEIRLRIGATNDEINYRGNIGCTVFEKFRGFNYAARSSKLLRPIAKSHQLNPIWLTCDENNIAAIKSIESLGAEYVDSRAMTEDYPYAWYYPIESRVKRRYKWIIY